MSTVVRFFSPVSLRIALARGVLVLQAFAIGQVLDLAPAAAASSASATSAAASSVLALPAPEKEIQVLDWIRYDRLNYRDLDSMFEGNAAGDIDPVFTSHVTNQPAIFHDEVRYDARPDSLGLQDFLALPVAEQRARRAESFRALERLRRFVNLIHGYLHRRDNGEHVIWGSTSGIKTIGQCLHALVNATGLDPANPWYWHILAYFAEATGDWQRTKRALDAASAALAYYPDDYAPAIRFRLRMDHAWWYRDRGEWDEASRWLAQARALISKRATAAARADGEIASTDSSAPAHTSRPIHASTPADLTTAGTLPTDFMETRLLEGLILAGRGQIGGAAAVGRQVTFENVMPRWSQTMGRWIFKPVTSTYAENWIRALSLTVAGKHELALHALGRPNINRGHPYFGRRYWNDIGHVLEMAGDFETATSYYAMSLCYRPYENFFIHRTRAGLPGQVDNPCLGMPYFQAFGMFFLTGSCFSNASNLALEFRAETDPTRKSQLGRDAEEALSLCIRTRVYPLRAQILRGVVRLRRNDTTGATTDLQAAATILAQQPESGATLLLMTGIGLTQLGDEELAIPLLERAIVMQQRHGDENEGVSKAGRAALRASVSESARLALREASQALAWRTLAIAQINSGASETGRANLDRALAIDPRAVAGWYNRGLLSLKEGRLAAGRDDLRQASRLAPGDLQIVSLIRKVNRAIAEEQTNLAEAAAEFLLDADDNLAAQLDPALTTSLLSRRALRLAHGQPAYPDPLLVPTTTTEADVLACRQAFAEQPRPTERRALARALIRSGDHAAGRELLLPVWNDDTLLVERCLILEADRALSDGERALALAERLSAGRLACDSSYFWSLVAFICLDLGQQNLGRQALTRALELDPSNQALQTQMSLLGS